MEEHGIPRDEWERRFKERIMHQAALTEEEVRLIVKAELESWPDTHGDWKTTTPEEAADEQLSYWTD